jgi:Domain of unknown function (DUF4386)
LTSAGVADQSQLDWERRTGPRAAVAALAGVALLVGYVVLQQVVALSDRPGNSAEFLQTIDKNSGPWVAAAVLQGLSAFALAAVLWYLFTATRHRRPELPAWAVYVAFLAAALLTAAYVLSALDQLDTANRFLAHGETTKKRADDLLDDRSGAAVGLGAGGGLGMALSLVLVSLNAMRVGLVSRFLGILGVIVGALQVLPVLPPFVLEIFWLGALAVLFLDRWPGGRGPAWDTGESIPWPTAAERAQVRAGEPSPEPEPPPEEPESPKPASRKRKRKTKR